jgi:hypothetical protein
MKIPFTKNNVLKASIQNKSEKGDWYHHPTEKDIKEKCIDLSCIKPLHERNNEPKGKNTSAEKWLEAYVIQLAKRERNYDGLFDLAGKKYRFLYSQFTFRSTDKHGPRFLDCLLFDPESNHLVIIELKADRALKKAVDELDYYAHKLDEIKDELIDIFELNGIPAIEGYIVWPRNDKGHNAKYDFGGWGLIEYSDDVGMVKNGKLIEPWEKYKHLGQVKKESVIEFIKSRPSKIF